MKSTRTHLKAAFSIAALTAAGLLAAPAHAGLLVSGSFEALVYADGSNCPDVPLGKSCLQGAGAKPQPDGSDVASLLFKGAEKAESSEELVPGAALTVAFVRDSFGAGSGVTGSLDAVGLVCAAHPEVCRVSLYGSAGGDGVTGAGMASGMGLGSGPASASASAGGGASSAFNLGFMQALGGVQVSPQYGVSFLQAGTPVASRGAGATGGSTASERWEVTYGASNQPAAAAASFEGSAGGSSLGSMEFQSTSTTQLQTYMASGSSGLLGGGAQFAPNNSVPFGTPEPSALLLVGVAMTGLWIQRRRQTRQI